MKFQETDMKFQETARRFQETDKEIQKTMRLIKDANKRAGYLENRFGELAEHLVAPGIAKKFNDMGYCFDDISPGGKKIIDNKGCVIAEIDLLLENGQYIVAVEVKAKPCLDDIADHIKRLETLRRHRDKHADKRKIRGAIAGAIFPANVKTATLKAGLYVIGQSGKTMTIEIPKDFNPAEW
jgi:hypothetical protein